MPIHIIILTDFDNDFLYHLFNRYYKRSNPVVFGHGIYASYTDLQVLDQYNLKSVTGLSKTDLLNADPMSANQAIKISSKIVQNALKKYSPQAKGSILYLKLMVYSFETFNSQTLSANERLHKIWFVCFVLRIWKSVLHELGYYF